MSLTFHTCLLHCGSGFRVALRRAVIVFSGAVGIRQGFTRSDGASEHSFFPFLATRFLLRSPGFLPISYFPCLPDPSALSHGALCFLSLPLSSFSLLSSLFSSLFSLLFSLLSSLTFLPHLSPSHLGLSLSPSLLHTRSLWCLISTPALSGRIFGPSSDDCGSPQ